MNIIPSVSTLFTIGFSLIILSGCGSSSNSDTTSSSQQPRELSDNSFSGVNVLSRKSTPAPTLTYDANSITISHTVSDGASVPHYQFFLNVDDDLSTGFSFGQVAWGEIGADYLIQDGVLYKSNTNGNSWDWDINTGAVNSVVDDNSFSIVINRSLLSNLSSKINLGFVVLDENWSSTDFYPQSSQMASFSLVDPISTDTEAPILSLNGSNAMRVVQGSVFHDPGVYAYDEVDGDISHTAIVNTVTTERVGTSTLSYKVTDLAGNSATIIRAVTVIKSEDEGIVIDGNIDDWDNISEVASNSTGVIKVENNYGYLNIMVQASEFGENTQIFINTDNDSTTGLQFLGGDWDFGGADYMVENRNLNKSTNPNAWSWDYAVAPIHYIKKGNVIELAILKSNLENLGSTIKIGFVNRDSEWTISHEMLPATSMATYTLLSANIQIPDELIDQLCDATQLIDQELSPSLSDGVLYYGKRYYSELVTNDNLYTVTIYSQNEDGSDTRELISNTYSNRNLANAGVRTLNGSLIISVTPPGRPSRSRENFNYRITELHEIIDYGTNIGSQSSNQIGEDLGFVANTFYFKLRPIDGRGPTSIIGYNELSGIRATYFSEILDTFSFDPIFSLRTTYSNGKIYYAYTPGQLVNSRVLTNVGPRILGVIDDESGLKPVTVCDNPIGR